MKTRMKTSGTKTTKTKTRKYLCVCLWFSTISNIKNKFHCVFLSLSFSLNYAFPSTLPFQIGEQIFFFRRWHGLCRRRRRRHAESIEGNWRRRVRIQLLRLRHRRNLRLLIIHHLRRHLRRRHTTVHVLHLHLRKRLLLWL